MTDQSANIDNTIEPSNASVAHRRPADEQHSSKYRRELLISLNIMLLAVFSVRLALDGILGNTTLILSSCINILTFGLTLVAFKKNFHIEKIATVLGALSVIGFISIFQASEGGNIAGLLAAPAFIAIASIFLSGFAVYLAISIIVAVSGYHLLSFFALSDSALILQAESIQHIFIPNTVISLIIVLYTLMKYRSIQEKASRKIRQEQETAMAANDELVALVVQHELRTKMQIRLQHVGKMVGWCMDVRERVLSVSIRTEEGEYNIVNAALDEDFRVREDARSEQFSDEMVAIGRKFIYPSIAKALKDGKPWDLEYELEINGGMKWYRSVGETETDQDGIRYILGVTHDITDNKLLTRELEKQANHDALTGLRNRRSLDDKLQAALNNCNETDYYYLFIDLDRFKLVNDTSGHLAGDELLKMVSRIIQKCLRHSDTAGRVGGDEFGILLESCSEEAAMNIANRIRTEVNDLVFCWNEDQHRIGATIGALKLEAEIENIETLQLLADSACLEAKSEGRNRVKLSTAANSAVIEKRENSRWLQRLQSALTEDSFVLCVQEIIPASLTERNRKAYEVLIRLRSPDRKQLIAPGAFLPFAERYNLCVDIDIWVTRQIISKACAQRANGENLDSFWINLSGQSISDSRFADFVVDALAEASLPFGTINFEITETEVIRDMSTAVGLIQKLKQFGSQFALDDFGSGLASFGYLKKLPVDVIKIDGMFIREINEGNLDKVFTKSIIDVAHAIGIKTVAEFVENKTVLDAVTELGVDYLQGFGIHRPEEIVLKDTSEEPKQSFG